MIWATVSSWSFFCWLYRSSPFLAAKNIIKLIQKSISQAVCLSAMYCYFFNAIIALLFLAHQIFYSLSTYKISLCFQPYYHYYWLLLHPDSLFSNLSSLFFLHILFIPIMSNHSQFATRENRLLIPPQGLCMCSFLLGALFQQFFLCLIPPFHSGVNSSE